MDKCPKCQGETKGWKCAICGNESAEHDANHKHADSDRYCTMKCKSCGQADVHCNCAEVGATETEGQPAQTEPAEPQPA